ncbi:MAG TPA: F0F1 ATP synthase subunit gamma [Acidimicrobiia bacterium]|nr:F0F1 ATP synthase subunit gamma [Acidimicrobiia bacterium]
MRRQLDVARELSSVVTTMKSLAAVELREHEQAVSALAESVRVLQSGFQAVFHRYPDLVPVDEMPDRTEIAIVFGTDQGLCGPLNRIIVRRALAEIGDADVMAVGLRAARELEVAGRAPIRMFGLPGTLGAVGESVKALVFAVDERRVRHSGGRVVLIHHRPRGRQGYEPRVVTVSPLDRGLLAAIARRPWPTRCLPTSMGDPRVLLQSLTRQAVSYSLHRAFTEARASEHAGRLIAMQNAEQSITEREEELARELHRLRQATITAELLDVVAGFEAVAGQD